jgi:hypothetical protein
MAPKGRMRSHVTWPLVAALACVIVVLIWMADTDTRTPTTKLSSEVTAIPPVAQSLRRTDVSPDEKARYMRKVTRLRDALGEIYRLKPLPDTERVVTPTGPCSLPFLQAPVKLADLPEGREIYKGPGLSSGSRPRVAVSLVVIKNDDMLRISVSSLLASDIIARADVTIFVWYNWQGSNAETYMKSITQLPVIEVPNPSGENQGIVMPRIRVMEAMLTHGCNFQWFLEMHDDMFFYPTWFQPLIDHDKPNYGILMPFVVTGSK